MPPKSKPSEDAMFLHKILPNESTKKHVETSAKHHATKVKREKLTDEELAGAAGHAARRLLQTPRPEEIPKREKAIDAHLGRLARLMERGVDVQERIWESALSNLIIKPEDIPESYWQQQAHIARDNGQGDIILDSRIREQLTKQLQDAQRTGAESWSTYLKQIGDQYPLWFKYYVWNGMSKLGVFDKEKAKYKTRDKETVAPYPELNPSALAKVYDDLNNYKNGILPDDEDHANRIKNANFNELYSYHLLNEKAIIPTPERAEDVRGEWRHYTSKDIDEITKASEGTPWCIAGTHMAESYTQGGGEFYLFHLQDPETGAVSPTACASIRLKDGKVAEISGLKTGAENQNLEDALVPVVEEKVRNLPGGERYLKAFADKNMLIRIDRKFQAGEDFTDEELRFLYELDRPIEYMDTYSRDPRPEQFKSERNFMSDMARITGLEDHKEIALYLIDAGYGSFVAYYLHKFEGLDHQDIAIRLIDAGEGYYVAFNLDKFESLDHQDIATRLIDAEQGDYVARNLDKFEGLNQDIATRLIDAGEGVSVAENLNKFEGLDHQDIAIRLIDAGYGRSVAYNLDKFNGLDHNDIATRLIDAGYSESVARNLYKFEGLNQDIAIRLINAGKGYAVAENLDKFEGLDHQDIAIRLLDTGQGEYVAFNLDKFEGLDHQDIAIRLINAGQVENVARNLYKFKGLNQDIATRLIDAEQGWSIAENLNKFEGLNQDIAIRLINAGQVENVARNLYKFKGLNQDIATRLIDAGYGSFVAHYLRKFEGLNQDIAIRLIDAGRGEDVARNLKNFQGLDEATLKKLEPYLKKT